MAMTLPTECWQEILKNVPIEDKKTLNSPHDQPMPSRINEQEEIIKMKINQKKLINVYISCMDYKSIDILNNNKIEIINMDKSIMFDYPSMLQFKVTTEDLEHNSKTREFKKLLLTRELCKMFMKSSTLIMNLTLSYYVPFVDILLIDQWKEITKDLTKICGTNGSLEILELKCIGEPSVEWIDDKSFINICELIKRQKSLKHIKLNCCGKYCNISKAISSLSSQIDNIKSLEFVHLKFNSNNDNFPLNFISKCKKLNTLIFKDCDELLDYNIFTIKDTPWFNHLTKLVFEDTSISPFNITKIISFCNKLKELSCDLGEEIEFLPEFALSLPISLKHLTIDAVEININILQQFLENIKATLETLNFPAWICRSFTDQHLYIICDKLKNSLKRLDLDLMSPENQQHNVSFESIEYARKEIEVVNIESYFRYDSW
ncbi:unnamed protein product [Rhizophagus irregularis]|nr:unnamed protein product [Rhizophagus irregularis]